MKVITLSVAYYEAIKTAQGEAAAVEALRADIQKQVATPVELELRGPNHLGERVASLSFVTAAIFRPSRFGVVQPNLLTCGFDTEDHQAVAKLFGVLMHPQNILPHWMDEPVADEGDEGVKEAPAMGLVVGSFQKPEALITFER